MMSIDAAHKELQKWYDNGCVGNITIFRSPRATYVDMVFDETIKMKEMDSEVRDLVRDVIGHFGGDKVTLFTDKNGYADRANVIRRP